MAGLRQSRSRRDRLRVWRRHARSCVASLHQDNSTATSSDLAILFDEQSYAYNQPYKGARNFNKHYFSIIGDLKAEGEEFRCAVHIDEHPKVRFWVRNVDRKPNAFWFQLPSGRFHHYFVAMLTDGRILAVEYKGKHLAEDAKDKRIIGDQ